MGAAELRDAGFRRPALTEEARLPTNLGEMTDPRPAGAPTPEKGETVIFQEQARGGGAPRWREWRRCSTKPGGCGSTLREWRRCSTAKQRHVEAVLDVPREGTWRRCSALGRVEAVLH